MYHLEISQVFQANQGLKSPVRAAEGLQPLTTSFTVMINVGINFSDDQLTSRGWFVDTDAVERQLAHCADYLASDAWTQLFEFRPTFELVAKWTYDRLSKDIPQLQYVELDNKTIAVKTRYEGREE
jgi:hypothetical protein